MKVEVDWMDRKEVGNRTEKERWMDGFNVHQLLKPRNKICLLALMERRASMEEESAEKKKKERRKQEGMQRIVYK